MEKTKIHNLITEKSFKGTIERDPASCFWFSKAVITPEVNGHWELGNALLKDRKTLGFITLAQKMLYFLCIPVLLCLYLAFGHPLFLWGNIAIAVSLYFLERLKIKRVTEISWHWVNTEFSKEEIDNLTYFQITERLGKKYGMPTLVDTITRWDWMLRRWFLAIYVIGSLILFLNLIKLIVVLVIAFAIAALFLRNASS